jgi:hypothetical protein
MRQLSVQASKPAVPQLMQALFHKGSKGFPEAVQYSLS